VQLLVELGYWLVGRSVPLVLGEVDVAVLEACCDDLPAKVTIAAPTGMFTDCRCPTSTILPARTITTPLSIGLVVGDA